MACWNTILILIVSDDARNPFKVLLAFSLESGKAHEVNVWITFHHKIKKLKLFITYITVYVYVYIGYIYLLIFAYLFIIIFYIYNFKFASSRPLKRFSYCWVDLFLFNTIKQ